MAPSFLPNTTTVAATSPPYPHVPPPWQLRGDVYLVAFWMPRSAIAAGLPAHAFSPLEARSDFAAPPGGARPVGGLGMIQVIRYSESPVGPYDELIFVPGAWEWQRGGEGPKRRNPRITRIYVSQPFTCFNGRRNWGVPKHLARFDWATLPDGTTTVKVFPHDTIPSDTTESSPSPIPLFQASFRPRIPYIPRFPFATYWADYLGLSTTLVMPPLPENPHASLGEIPASDRWYAIEPKEYSRQTSLGWVDLDQGEHRPREDCPNFWPGVGRWHLGVKMENATIDFGFPTDSWEVPKSSL
ncbi:hypothetical protein S40293_01195 [Stachybotrys chartarum IBT 40293]|nr:hypothetical protein S40293_01195 [Stachybotrys chartarum IBT 40293]KFA77687.1 hypothetical protein S40288_02731 [Stachybotrys chartarum IBT 40288]